MFTACAPPEQVLKTLFEIAVKNNDVKQLQKLLKTCKSDLQNVESGRLLWQAIRKGHAEIAEMLVHAGVDLTYRRDKNNETYLHYLVNHDSPENCKLALLMVDRGADVRACDSKNVSVVEHALDAKADDFNDGLIERGVVKDTKSDLPVASSDRVAEQPESEFFEFNDDVRVDVISQNILCCQHSNVRVVQSVFGKIKEVDL